MKTLLLIPDAASARVFGPAVEAFPPDEVKVIAFGRAVGALLPPDFPAFVYPLAPGNRLPAPFLEALIRHEGAQAVMAPKGLLTCAPVPALIFDIETSLPEDPPELAEPTQWAFIEGVARNHRLRMELLSAGFFAAHEKPGWFTAEGTLAPTAVPEIRQTLARLAGKSLAPEKPALAPAILHPDAAVAEPPAADPTPASWGVKLMQPSSEEPVEVPIHREPPPFGSPEASSAETFRGLLDGRRALVLTGGSGLDRLQPQDLCEASVLCVPEALPWLDSRLGSAQFVCTVSPPTSPVVQDALAHARTVLVHSPALEVASLAPRARQHVPLLDLHQAGGPALGWSDDMVTGFFPGGGDAALALQWAAWLGATEILIAGEPLAPGDDWPLFCAGAEELLNQRGLRTARWAPEPLAVGVPG